MNRKGIEVLTETVIFLILNLVFLAMLIVFIYLRTSSAALVEQDTAKQIALLVDVSKPGAEIELNIEDVVKYSEKNGIMEEEAIRIDNQNNLVIVKLSEKSQYEYSFFNDVEVIPETDFHNKILFMVVK